MNNCAQLPHSSHKPQKIIIHFHGLKGGRFYLQCFLEFLTCQHFKPPIQSQVQWYEFCWVGVVSDAIGELFGICHVIDICLYMSGSIYHCGFFVFTQGSKLGF